MCTNYSDSEDSRARELAVSLGECVTESGVDDGQKDSTADCSKRQGLPLQPLLREPSHNLMWKNPLFPQIRFFNVKLAFYIRAHW